MAYVAGAEHDGGSAVPVYVGVGDDAGVEVLVVDAFEREVDVAGELEVGGEACLPGGWHLEVVAEDGGTCGHAGGAGSLDLLEEFGLRGYELYALAVVAGENLGGLSHTAVSDSTDEPYVRHASDKETRTSAEDNLTVADYIPIEAYAGAEGGVGIGHVVGAEAPLTHYDVRAGVGRCSGEGVVEVVVVFLVEVVVEAGVEGKFDAQTEAEFEAVADVEVVLCIPRELVCGHVCGEHGVVLAVAVCHTEHAGSSSEDAAPVAGSHLLGSGLVGIVSAGSLCKAVCSLVHLVLHTGNDVVLAEVHVHLIGHDEGLGLREVALREDVAGECPCGIVSLSVVHHHLDDGLVAVLGAAGLVLEGVGGTQGVLHALGQTAVQLACHTGEVEVAVVAAGEGAHAVVRAAAVGAVGAVVDVVALVYADGAAGAGSAGTLAA